MARRSAGTVFIAPAEVLPPDVRVDAQRARFWVVWQADAEPNQKLGETHVDGADAALRWGRARSDRVVIRIDGRQYFSAGAERLPDLPEWSA